MKPTQLLRVLLLISYLSTTIMAAHAQGWEKKYSPDRNLQVTTLTQLHDQSYYASGNNVDNYLQFRLMRIAADGSVISVHDYDSLSLGSLGVVPHDGGYVSIGLATYDSVGSVATRAIIRVDSMGNKKWLKFIPAYPGAHVVGNMSIDTTDNNGFIYALSCYATDTSTTVSRIVRRLDANGDTIWSHSYFDGDSTMYIAKIRNAKDGGFIMNMSGGMGPSGAYSVVKIDSSGNILWQFAPPFTNATIGGTMAHDGNIIINGAYYTVGSNNIPIYSTYLGKIDQNGHQLWVKDYGVMPDSIAFGSIIENSNHTYTALGGKYSPVERFYYFLVDSTHVIEQHMIPQNFERGFLYNGAFIPTADHGYMLGVFTPAEPNHNTLELIKMDSAGMVYPHLLSGKAFLDYNNNCVKDSGELFLNNSILTFSNATDTFTVATNDSGFYNVGLNSGLYNLQITPLTHYTIPSTCNTTNISVSGLDSVINFGVQPTVRAPYISVSGAARQRSCFPENTYTAQYCNHGTASFTGTITITLESVDIVDSASAPWILPQAGNVYRFAIDTLDILECATVNIYYHLSCDPDLLHRTVCIYADVYADTVVNPSPNWDRSNLVMTARCNLATDSVEFKLKNIGTGTTAPTLPEMIVIEDNVISVKHVAQLAAGAEYNFSVPANGSTWRATAQQTPFNPYSSFTTAAIEGCGRNLSNDFSKGFLLQYPDNGYYAFHATTCAMIGNSYDPNHKSVVPEGAGTEHLVDSTTELRYTIEFQNTGNDTAYLVGVIDTLADYLDAATIQPGVSSHPYTMELSDNHVINFTFYNIMLPDSGHDQTGSNGYVQFKIKQKHNNRVGTVINNDAAIYFDYNAPVITNTATVKVGQLVISGIENLYSKAILINAYPNPFDNQTIIKVDGESFDQLELRVFDISGKTINQQQAQNTNQFMLNRHGFSMGSYLFEITMHGKIVGRGKLVAE